MVADSFEQLRFSFAGPSLTSHTSPLSEHPPAVDGGLPTGHDLAASWASSLTSDNNAGFLSFSPRDFEAFHATGTGSPDNAHQQPAFQTGVFDPNAHDHPSMLSHTLSTSSLDSLSSFSATGPTTSSSSVDCNPPEQFTLPLSQPASHSHSRALSISSHQEFDSQYHLSSSSFTTMPSYSAQGFEASAGSFTMAQPNYEAVRQQHHSLPLCRAEA